MGAKAAAGEAPTTRAAGRSRSQSAGAVSVAPDASGKRTLWLVLALVIGIILLAAWLW